MKGSILDVIFIFALGMIISVVVIFVFLIMTNLNTAMVDSSVFGAQAESVMQAGIESLKFWDYLIIFAIGSMFMITLISATQINAHPAFFIGALLFLIVTLIVGAQLSNMYIMLVENANIAGYTGDFLYTKQFFQNGPTFILLYSVVLMIVMFTFGRNRNEMAYM